MPDDLEPFYDMQSDPDVMRYIKAPMNHEQSQKELERFISYYSHESAFFNIWAMVDKASMQFVGICGVYENEQQEFEIAYRLRQAYWGKGYGREIARSLISYCFEHLGLKDLTAYADSRNQGSITILEKEMMFVKEFYSEKTQVTERKYSLKLEQ
ncbi:GNAT family N-acetyltransferase [Pleionea sp. CnH1-48]|nr:GNAT family N-acetyltransferase [Pleionea sp. CnH1-48]